MEIGEKFASGLVKFSFRLERFFPQFIKFFLKRKLKECKERGVITEYKVKSKRKGKYHYLIEVDLFLRIRKGGEPYG